MSQSWQELVDPLLSVPCPHDPESRDFVLPASWNTSPGRIPMWCPSRQVSFRMSLSELPEDASPELRYWVAGFVAGSTPDPPDPDEMTEDDLRAWDARVEAYRSSGTWLPD